MKLKAIRLLTATFASAVLAFTMACGSGSQTPSTPSTPTPTPTPGGATLAAPAPMSPIGGETITVRRPTFSVRNAAATGNVGTVTYQFEVSEMDSFPANSRTSSVSDIAQGDGTTTWVPPSDLLPNAVNYWHARATNGTITSDWSRTETFKTP
jgi:hypothetical protein